MSSITQLDPTRFDAGFAGHRGLTLVRGEGAHVFDADGRRYLDATSMYGVSVLGHAHPGLAQAIATQAGRLVSCFASYANDRRAELLERLHRRLAPLDRFFLCNSGTEAVEAAIKLARATTGRTGVVALSGAFHGRSFGALSATFRGRHRDAFQPLLDGFVHVRPGDEERLLSAIDDSVGLVLVEAVQGEGGVRVIDPEFLRAVEARARDAGALLGVDEVQTGLGRTGRWFGYEHSGVQPDLVCLAKALGGGVPVGALAFRGERAALGVGAHGSTFGGNPLACAAAVFVLDAIEREGLVERAALLGRHAFERLREDLRPAPGAAVRDVRGSGAMIGIELATSSVPLQRRLQERGFLTLGAGPRVLRLLPPLTTELEDLDRLCDAIAEEVEA